MSTSVFDPYEAIRQAYLDGTETESKPFEDPIHTETLESPLAIAPPISLSESTSSVLIPILRRTARMAVRVPHAMSSGLSASMVQSGATQQGQGLTKDEIALCGGRGSYCEVEGPGMHDEGYGLDDERHGDESRGIDDKGHSVESDRLGLEEDEEAAPVLRTEDFDCGWELPRVAPWRDMVTSSVECEWCESDKRAQQSSGSMASAESSASECRREPGCTVGGGERRSWRGRRGEVERGSSIESAVLLVCELRGDCFAHIGARAL
ncbi:hypothetical protein Tco_0679842 [Tanacetum coccineum]|uniref:Uncharacterized protein n=1 Tax=Tanacetum coccineum TaxID=301880 RepID=A0ABQ4XIZ1_9ASTR